MAVGGRPQFFTRWKAPQGCVSVLMAWWLASLRLNAPRERAKGGSHNAFSDLVLEIIHLHFCHILFFRRELLSPAHTQREGKSLHLLEKQGIKEYSL